MVDLFVGCTYFLLMISLFTKKKKKTVLGGTGIFITHLDQDADYHIEKKNYSKIDHLWCGQSQFVAT